MRPRPKHDALLVWLVAGASLIPLLWSGSPPAARAEGTVGRHVVQTGETLYCIGRAYGVWPAAIAQANNLGRGDWLVPGMVLAIPAAPWDVPLPGPVCAAQFVSPFVPSTRTPPAIVSTSGIGPVLGNHVVHQGESVYCIGRAYRVLPSAILQANGLRLQSLLRPGRILVIPAERWTTLLPGPECRPQFASPFRDSVAAPPFAPSADSATPAVEIPPASTATPAPFTPTNDPGPTKTAVPTRTVPPKP